MSIVLNHEVIVNTAFNLKFVTVLDKVKSNMVEAKRRIGNMFYRANKVKERVQTEVTRNEGIQILLVAFCSFIICFVTTIAVALTHTVIAAGAIIVISTLAFVVLPTILINVILLSVFLTVVALNIVANIIVLFV